MDIDKAIKLLDLKPLTDSIKEDIADYYNKPISTLNKYDYYVDDHVYSKEYIESADKHQLIHN